MTCYLKLTIEIKSYKYSFKSIISLLKMSTNWSERAPDKLNEIDRKEKKDSSYKGSEEYRNMLKEKSVLMVAMLMIIIHINPMMISAYLYNYKFE